MTPGNAHGICARNGLIEVLGISRGQVLNMLTNIRHFDPPLFGKGESEGIRWSRTKVLRYIKKVSFEKFESLVQALATESSKHQFLNYWVET